MILLKLTQNQIAMRVLTQSPLFFFGNVLSPTPLFSLHCLVLFFPPFPKSNTNHFFVVVCLFVYILGTRQIIVLEESKSNPI